MSDKRVITVEEKRALLERLKEDAKWLIDNGTEMEWAKANKSYDVLTAILADIEWREKMEPLLIQFFTKRGGVSDGLESIDKIRSAFNELRKEKP